MANFKYKNLNILQPFVSKTKIYSCKCREDIIHINNLDKGDTNLSVKYVSDYNTHNIVDAMTKDKFIELIMKEIENI